MACGGMDYIQLAQDRIHVAGFCECDEHLGSIKARYLLTR